MQKVDRLDGLERRVRWLQIYAGATTCLLLASATLNTRSASFDVVTARQFVVLDANAQTRAVLGMQEEPGTESQVVGNVRVEVPVTESFVALRLTGEEVSAQLVVKDGNEPYLALLEGEEHETILNTDELTINDVHEDSFGYLELNPDGVTFSYEEEGEEEGQTLEASLELKLESGLHMMKLAESSSSKAGWEAGLFYEDIGETPKFFVRDADGKTVYEKP